MSIGADTGSSATIRAPQPPAFSAFDTPACRSVEGKRTLDALVKLTDELKRRTDKLAKALDHESNGSAEKHAKHFRDTDVPAMAALRETGDALEVMIPHETWPLATYREMLFIK